MESAWLMLTVALLGAAGLWVLSLVGSGGKKKQQQLPLPPGPRPLPIIGNMHLLVGPVPHVDMSELSKRYGPLMHLQLGSVHTIVVSSPEMAEQFLRIQDANFANRINSEAFLQFSYGGKTFSFADSGNFWRETRRLCISHLFSQQRIAAFRPVRTEEIRGIMKSIEEAADSRSVVNISTTLGTLTASMACRIILGKKFQGEGKEVEEFWKNTREMLVLLGTFNVNDYIPLLKPFDIQGVRKRLKVVHKTFDDFIERMIDEHFETGKWKAEDEEGKDFIDIMIGLMHSDELVDGHRVDRTVVKAIVLDMLIVFMDTLRTPVEWAFSELLKNPRVMKRVQEEVEAVVGPHRQLEESDLPQLEYLSFCVKESLRLHPQLAFVIHRGKDEAVVDGYRIPANSTVMINIWKIGRDPTVWSNADQYMPERFLDNGIDTKGNDCRFLYFGSGRRMCVGMNLALIVVPLVLGQLAHGFDWELAGGIKPSELDMNVAFGLTMPKAVELKAVPTKRLRA